MTKQKAKNVLYRLVRCKPDYLFAEQVIEIIWSFGNIIEKREKQIKELEAVNKQAKKIIREVIEWLNDIHEEPFPEDLADKAEAFLNKE